MVRDMDPTAHTQAADEVGYARLSDIDEFIARTQDYADGKLSADQYRAYRLTRGVYGQRQEGVFMMRVKLPGGIVTPPQIAVLAELAAHTPEGLGHITTRENLQFHHMPPGDVPLWMHKLAEVGVTMVDACGNAVRTVTQDPWAGLGPDDAFDTTPYVEAITRYFLRNARVLNLPRKFKIALSASSADRAYACINDLGLIAVRTADGAPAFRVLIGGGLASMPRSGLVVHEAWPARDILTPCAAAIDLFQEHGNRAVRSKARIKHVLRKLGDEAFAALYATYLERVQADPPPAVLLPAPATAAQPWQWDRPQDAASRASGLFEWAQTCVGETRLPGLVFVTVRLDRGGELTAQHLRDLGALTSRYGQGTLHFTPQQNALLRAVAIEDLPALHAALQAAGLAKPGAGAVADITSCPGVSTCNLGVTYSRNLADELSALTAARGDTDLSIKISGCHNSCGHHHVGTIGLYGALKRLNGRAAPHYRLLVGGGVEAKGAIFGEDLGLLPARRVPEAIRRLLAHADQHRAASQSAGAYLRCTPAPSLKFVVADLLDLGDGEATEQDFWDIGASTAFRVDTREGECAA